MKLELLNIRDERVQDFLWQHLEPTDFRYDYTRLDAIKEVERQVYSGDTQLWGDLHAKLMFRCEARNPKVLEPHIMGDGMLLRGGLQQGAEIAWGLGFEKLVIWTHHEQIARIVEKCGFTLAGRMPGLHMDKAGALADLYCLTMERPNAL